MTRPCSRDWPIAPQGIVGFTAGFFGPRLSAHLGVDKLLVLTGAAATAGFLILAHLPTAGPYGPALIAVVLVGFGTAGTAFGATVIGTGRVADSDQGLVGGVINTTRQVGAALGAALLLAIADSTGGAHGIATVGGDRNAMLAGAAAAGLATMVALRIRRASNKSQDNFAHVATSMNALLSMNNATTRDPGQKVSACSATSVVRDRDGHNEAQRRGALEQWPSPPACDGLSRDLALTPVELKSPPTD